MLVIRTLLVAVAGWALGACSLISVKQDPFPPMQIRADRPPPPPSRVVLTASSIEIKDKVQFESGKAELLEVSSPLLKGPNGKLQPGTGEIEAAVKKLRRVMDEASDLYRAAEGKLKQ